MKENDMEEIPTHNGTQRILNIFNLLVKKENTQLTLSEIAEQIDAPKSSLFPIIKTMAANDYLSYNGQNRTYSIGRRLFEAGMCYFRSSSLAKDIQKILEKAVRLSNEACSYAELDGREALIILRVDSPEPVKMYSNIGKRVPLHCSALGKALMSDKTDDEIRAFVSGDMDVFTPNTIQNIDVYIEKLRNMKKHGFFMDNGEHTYDVMAIAVPIIRHGRAEAAMSIAMPSYRFNDKKRLICENTLINAKKEIESLINNFSVNGMLI